MNEEVGALRWNGQAWQVIPVQASPLVIIEWFAGIGVVVGTMDAWFMACEA
ncbi:MAG: hypothetical protein R3B37_07880 [Nitrospira sp.]|nr:hypothetical protein [Nitrospira sp.]